METKKISSHQMRVFLVIKNAGGTWMNTKEIASKADVGIRATNNHVKTLLSLGVIDMVEAFPSRLFRLSELPDRRNKAYMNRLEKAIDASGVKIDI